MSAQAGGGGNDYQVVVVGFGPTGAVGTGLLGQRGIRTLAVDRLRDIYDKPRAIAIDHEILRLIDNLGALEPVLPHVAPFPASRHFGADGQLIRQIDMVPAPYPLGYTPSMVFTQPPVEAALRAHAASFPAVEISLGTELAGFEQGNGGVRLQLRDDTGAARTVTADYVIACDGASSPVRQQLGIALEDLVFDEPWLVVDVVVHDHALAKLPATAAQFCEPARPASFIVGPGNHRRWEIMLLPDENPRAMEAPARVWELLSRWITPDDATLWRAASYRFHALVAAEWRKGRIFLAGDAAHQQPPFIGQGMCQGMRDISNLVWKLDRVLDGRSSDALLDTYPAERGAHVRELTARIKAIGEVICERDPAAARARDARILAEGGGQAKTITRQEIVPPLRQGLLGTRPSPANGTLFPQPLVESRDGPMLLDRACGSGWRLVLDGRCEAPLSREAEVKARELGLRVVAVCQPQLAVTPQPAASSGGCTVVEVEGVVARWFDAYRCCAAIVRPDHYVFAAARDEGELVEVMRDLAVRLR